MIKGNGTRLRSKPKFKLQLTPSHLSWFDIHSGELLIGLLFALCVIVVLGASGTL